MIETNNEKRLKAILECSRLGTWEWNIQTGETHFNERWAEIVGYLLDELAPVSIKTWETLAHPVDLEASNELLQKHFGGKEPFHDFECRMKHKDGHWVWVHNRGKVVSWTAEGRPLLMFGTHEDITERKCMQAQLKEAHGFLESVLDQSPFPMWIGDANATLIRTNRALREALNLTDEQLVGRYNPLQDPNIVREGLTETIQTVLEQHKAARFRMLWRPVEFGGEDYQEGQNRHVDLAMYPIVHNGQLENIVTQWVDITELVQVQEDLTFSNQQLESAEIALRTSHEKLRDAQYLADIGSFTWEIETGRVTWSEGMYRLLKYDPDDTIDISTVNEAVHHRDDLERVTTWLSHGIESNAIRLEPNEYRLVRKDGSTITVRTNARIERVNGQAKQLLGTCQDITECKHAEEQLASEREHLAVTLESIGDGVISTDTNGTIVMLNSAAERMTGWSSTQAEGRPLSTVFSIINEVTRERCENPVEQVLKTGRTVELANHTALLTKDDREIVIADSAAPIKTAKGETIGVVLVFRDMTEKKKLESAVEVSSKLESLGVLAGGIAHDFNNLLGGIYGNIDMALESAEDETISQYLSITISTLDRARALTQQLLTFAKGGAPVQEISPLFPFVQETARFALSGSNVSCAFDIQQNLLNCNYDRNQISQVIDNLIINAQQAMPVGGTISVSARNISLAEKEHPLLRKGAYVRVAIKDCGIGIPKKLLKKIFDPFFTTKPKGHGLGLATCYSIVNRHGGCIDVYSEPGNGSVFNVYLPAEDTTANSDSKQSSMRHTGSGTFLVMDDEEIMRDTLKHMLESFGYSVVCKENGNDALYFLAAESKADRPVSGMIFDLTVPGGMGGMEAVAELRKTDVKTPVFVASGYADGPVMKNPVEYGFTAGICKPFRKMELMEMLEKHMKPGF
jgi:PAS domain S-box-containing protein